MKENCNLNILMFFLVPDDIDDDLAGVLHFCEEFSKRYGNCTPMFYQETLENALKESVLLPAKSVS